MSDNYLRLVTCSDFDGLVCAVLLKEMDMIDDIKFVHPKDLQDGTILIPDTDITTNLPYMEGVHLAFDHHSSEIARVEDKKDNYINAPQAPSAARVVYDHFGGKEKFPNVSDDMMEAVDKGDSDQFSEDEIVDAKGWALLNYLMDSRTGLGRFREFRVSNYNLMMQLIDFCRDHKVDDILDLPDMKEADQALHHGPRQPGGARSARQGNHLRRQPVYDLCAVPGHQHLDPRFVGAEQVEHRVRHRQIDHQPHIENKHRRFDA
jgi:nanoRNase/pAp phosphatase (c-di-AMP/oligoRNAs hydrolase)